MKQLRIAALGALLSLGLFALLRFPAESAAAARTGLSLALETVLPSLFPFFVLSALCVSCGAADALARVLAGIMAPFFALSGAGSAALVLGLLGGYPVGARTAAQLCEQGSLSRAEAEQLLAFCNNAGPGFVLGICGGAVFHSVRAGVYLYLIHAASALLTGLLLRRGSAPSRRGGYRAPRAPLSLLRAFPDAVRDSFAAVWNVCGFVILFAVLLRLLTLLLPASDVPLLLGAVELTNGVLALPDTRVGFVQCAALLAWGGLSVHAQTLSVLGELSARRYFLGKLIQTALSVPLALLASLRLF